MAVAAAAVHEEPTVSVVRSIEEYATKLYRS